MEPNRLIWILIYALVILSPTNAADFVLEIYGNANMDEHLDQADLDQFAEACHERTRRTGTCHRHYLSGISNTRTVLFHLGVLDRLPTCGGPVSSRASSSTGRRC